MGIAKQIKSEEPKVLVTHCFPHSLKLAVGNAINASKLMQNSLETTLKIKKLMKKLLK